MAGVQILKRGQWRKEVVVEKRTPVVQKRRIAH